MGKSRQAIDIEAEIEALRVRAVGNPKAEARMERLEYALRAAAAPNDDASAELRGLAMWELKRFEQILNGGD